MARPNSSPTRRARRFSRNSTSDRATFQTRTSSSRPRKYAPLPIEAPSASPNARKNGRLLSCGAVRSPATGLDATPSSIPVIVRVAPVVPQRDVMPEPEGGGAQVERGQGVELPHHLPGPNHLDQAELPPGRGRQLPALVHQHPGRRRPEPQLNRDRVVRTNGRQVRGSHEGAGPVQSHGVQRRAQRPGHLVISEHDAQRIRSHNPEVIGGAQAQTGHPLLDPHWRHPGQQFPDRRG